MLTINANKAITIMKNFIVISILMLSFFSCKEDPQSLPEPSWKSNHLINCYIIPDSLEILNQNSDYYYAEYNALKLAFLISGEKAYFGEVLENPEPAHVLFDSISNLNHDTGWYGTSGYFNPAVAYPVKNISIVSDHDFDSMHPAGSELIDIATIEVGTWGVFVLNGYPYGEEHLVYTNKAFANFSNGEKSLWYHGSNGIWLPIPTISNHHIFTITITFEGEKKISNTIEVNLSSIM